MLLESAAVLVFFALLETFVTGFIVLEEKMSSSEDRERDIRLVDGYIDAKELLCVFVRQLTHVIIEY